MLKNCTYELTTNNVQVRSILDGQMLFIRVQARGKITAIGNPAYSIIQVNGLSGLNSNLNTVSSSAVTVNTTNVGQINDNSVERCGKLVILRMQFNFKTMPTVGTAINVGTIPSGYRPINTFETYGLGAGSGWKETDLASISIQSDGNILVTQRRTAQNNWVKFLVSYFI